MPATTTPTSYLAGLKLVTSDGSGAASTGSFANATQYLCIPMSSLPELTGTEANPSTGDFRKIMFAIEDAVYASYVAQQALSTAPTKWVCARTSSINDSSDVVTRNFVNQFFTTTTGEEVASE
jgi:hypothetical protein